MNGFPASGIEELQEWAGRVHQLLYGSTEEMMKLKVSGLIKQFKKQLHLFFNDAQKGRTTRKMSIYVGHDSIMQALVSSFKLKTKSTPEFGSLFQVELYKDSKTGGYYFKAFYNGESIEMPLKCAGQKECKDTLFMAMLD